MKWSRAVHHVKTLADSCAGLAAPSPIFSLRVTQLWVVGDILGPPRELDVVTVALCVDLPADEVPWWSEPRGATHWANATRLYKNPFRPWWRSAHAPVWNHRIDRPALVWDDQDGVREEVLAALHEGRGEEVRAPTPDPEEFRIRLADELAISLKSLRAQTDAYDEQRWRLSKLTPASDALWRASHGYLDILDAM